MFLKPRKTDTLLGYYKRECKPNNINIIIKIIDNICVNHYENLDEKFEREIVEFTNEFIKDYPDYFKNNQDAIVFRLFSEISKKLLKNRKDEIHSLISEKQIQDAAKFSSSVFSLKKEMLCVASVGASSYNQQVNSISDIQEIAEYIVYCGAGVVLFYYIENSKKYLFGFMYINGKFEEINKKTLSSLSKKEDVTAVSFSEI